MANLAPVAAEFNAISLVEIGARFKYDRDGLITWLRQHGLLAMALECPARITKLWTSL